VSELFALDIETSGLDRFKDRIIGIGVYNPRHSEYLIMFLILSLGLLVILIRHYL